MNEWKTLQPFSLLRLAGFGNIYFWMLFEPTIQFYHIYTSTTLIFIRSYFTFGKRCLTLFRYIAHWLNACRNDQMLCSNQIESNRMKHLFCSALVTFFLSSIFLILFYNILELILSFSASHFEHSICECVSLS